MMKKPQELNIKDILDLLDSGKDDPRFGLATRLLAERGGRAIQELRKEYRRVDTSGRLRVIGALGYLGENAIPVLMAAMSKGETVIQAAAINAIKNIYARSTTLGEKLSGVSHKISDAMHDKFITELITVYAKTNDEHLGLLAVSTLESMGVHNYREIVQDVKKVYKYFGRGKFAYEHQLPPEIDKPANKDPAAQKSGDPLAAVIGRIDAFRDKTIPELQDALNAYLRGVAEEQTREKPGVKSKVNDSLSLEEKERIAGLVNSTAEKLGVDITYQGQACKFVVRGGTAQGRFHIIPKGTSTALLARYKLADFLPLNLVDSQISIQASPDWQEQEQIRRDAAATVTHRE